MAIRLHRSGHGGMKVPVNAVLVCDRVNGIKAQKGSQSNWPNEYFRHTFTKSSGKIYQLPSSTTVPQSAELIYDKIEQIQVDSKCHKVSQPFRSGKIYGLMNGALLVKSPGMVLLIVAPYELWDTFDYPDE